MDKAMLLDGEWVVRDEWTAVTDPETGREVGRVPLATSADVESAIESAERALMGRIPGHERWRVLSEAADRLEAIAEEAAVLVATEGIKTITEARAETRRAVETLRLSAEGSKRVKGETLNMDQYPSGAGRMGIAVRQPIGIIAAITPFNDPLNLVAHKVGPALAAGNAIIVKPDSKTPLSALLLAGVIQDAGLQPGWLQVVTGPGSSVGDSLVTHPAVGMVSFTGGVTAGRAVHARAGLKEISMELGANNAVIVHGDADLSLAAERIGSGAFWASGQNCLHVQRVYAQAGVLDELTQLLVKDAESRVLGPKLDEGTDLGPMIDESAIRRTDEIVSEAIGGGADLLTGGEQAGSSYRPTLLADVSPRARAFTEEIYGPVTVLSGYDHLDDAIERANDTDYGLAAAVFTSDISTAFTAASRLRAGQVMINDSTDFRIDAMPFGGGGASGIGREGVAHAIDSMTEPKVVAFSGVDVPGLG